MQIAAKMIELKMIGVTAGIWGRYSISTLISFYTNILVGNSIICIDSAQTATVENLNLVKAKILFIDSKQVKEVPDFRNII